MIPTANTDISVQTTVTGDKIAMSVDENSLAHIMSVLTNLYSDPEMAILREYSTNALDAHIAAGQTRPIEVELPSALAPFLRIKDYGIGLDEEDITQIYSKYGASTKRDTNDQTGVLGLGCKSALTYTAQFSLVGIKNGKRTMVSIARDEDGAGSMTIVEKGETNEPNGVEVIIPTARFNALGIKADNLFRFWKPGTVLVNGNEPERVEGMKVTDDLLVIENYGSDYLVMGGVPYPVNFSKTLSENYNLVLFAKIGEVNFTPSREALHYTRRTKDRIARAERDFIHNIDKAVQGTIDDAPSPREAFYTALKWRKALGRLLPLTFKDKDIPYEFHAPEEKFITITQAKSSKLSASSRYKVINAATLLNGVVVYGYDAASFTAAHKKKLQSWAMQNNITPESFILSENKIDSVWIDPASTVPWEVVKAIPLPRATNSGGPARVSGSYDICEAGTFKYEVSAEYIDDELPLFYVTITDFGADSKRYGARDTRRRNDAIGLLTTHHPDCTVVILGDNRVQKFKRDFPSAVCLREGLITLYNELKSHTSRDEIDRFYLRRCAPSSLRELSATLIDDPDVKRAVFLSQTPADETSISALKAFSGTLIRYLGISDILYQDDYQSPLYKYPLLNHSDLNHPHTYLYINAAYAADQ